ncbi:MAG: LPS assembly lipoprotein LptE [Myxococcaceae bacterium]
MEVPVFTNRTAESGVEAVFTESLREQCTRAGVLGGATSDARIEGEVRSIGGAPTILAPNGTLASYRLYGNAHLKLVKGGRVLSEIDVSGQEDYLPDRIDGDVLRTETNRTTAMRRLAETLMRDGYDRLTTGW